MLFRTSLLLLAPLCALRAGVTVGIDDRADLFAGYEWNGRWGVGFGLGFPQVEHEYQVDRNVGSDTGKVVWEKQRSGDFTIDNDLGTTLEAYRIFGFKDFDGEVNLRIWSLQPFTFLTENTFSLSYLFSRTCGGLRFYGGPQIGVRFAQSWTERYPDSSLYVVSQRTRTVSLLKRFSCGLRYAF